MRPQFLNVWTGSLCIVFIGLITLFVIQTNKSTHLAQAPTPKESAHTEITQSIVPNIDLSFEQHVIILNGLNDRLQNKLETLLNSETGLLSNDIQTLQYQLAEIERQLKIPHDSYKKRIEYLGHLIKKLRSFSGEVDNNLLSAAETALQQGITMNADLFLKHIEEQEAQPLSREAKAVFERGRIAESNINYKNAYIHFERAVGLSPDNPRYLDFAGSMAFTIARYQKAIEFQNIALALYLDENGDSSKTHSRLRNNLGMAWQNLGEYKKAIEYFDLALASDLQTYGEDHPSIATERNNLGMAWYSLGKYKKSIEYFDLALSSDLKTYGDDHPKVATERNNLGMAWYSLGKHKKSIKYFDLALASDLKTYGDDHPSVATERNNLGMVWQSLSKYKKAIRYFDLALASDLKTYGEDYPQVATQHNHLGNAWYALDNHTKAIKYYNLTLDTFKKTLGPDHPYTRVVESNLALSEQKVFITDLQ